MEAAATNHLLSGPRARLGRAEAHFKELKKQLDEFRAKLPLEVAVAECEPDSEYYALRVKGSAPAPLEFGVIVGDIAHNLRSALDNLMWHLIELNGLDHSQPGLSLKKVLTASSSLRSREEDVAKTNNKKSPS